MKKYAKAAVASIGLLAVSGVGLVEAVEYLQVAQNNVQEAVREGIPLGVEIDRMEVILKKMDTQVGQQKYEVAKAQVALEDSEAALGASRQNCDSLLADMSQLRDMDCSPKTVANRTSCGSLSYRTVQVSATDVKRALGHKLASYKAKTASLEAQETVVEKQRTAWRTLATRYDSWNEQRQLLSHRLEALRARHTAQKVGSGAVGSIDTTDLARVSKLADEIERKLRIAEKQEALGTSPVDQLLSGADSGSRNIEAEVDALLGRTAEVARAD